MNRKPNTSGITKYWVPGEDDRVELAKASGLGQEEVDMALGGLLRLVTRRKRVKLVGFGVFEWRPWRNRLPTGRFVETWRLVFKPGRYVPKYKEAKRRVGK